MKKKILVSIIAMAVLFLIRVSAYATAYVNNEDVSNEVFTTISNDYTLFPVRYLGEKLGVSSLFQVLCKPSTWCRVSDQ